MQNIVIAGATGDLGSLATRGLAREGRRLILLGRNLNKLSNLSTQLPGDSSFYQFDAQDSSDSLSRVFHSIAEEEGELHGMVSLLGYLNPAPILTTKSTDWIKSININLISNFELLKAFASSTHTGLETRQVVFLSSVAATRGDLGLSTYAASKAALESLVRSGAVEFARKNIAVNAIRLGLLDFGMGERIRERIGSKPFDALKVRYPQGLGKGPELVSVLNYLFNQENHWTTGSILTVDGGYSAT